MVPEQNERYYAREEVKDSPYPTFNREARSYKRTSARRP